MTTRRNFITGAASAAAAVAATKAAAQNWTPAARYPDAAIEILDPSFAKYRVANAAVERLGTGYRWCEGPVWFGDSRTLLWSDIPNDVIMKYDDVSNTVGVFRKPAGYTNGLARDRQGRLIACEHLGRRISRTEYDGTVVTLVDRFEGKRLNSPNDVVVRSDNSIWFTDPTFGIGGNYEGRAAPAELPHRVYRFDPVSREITIAAEGLRAPNGLAFSPDEKKLYLVEAQATPNRLIHAYDVSTDGKSLSGKRVLIDCQGGTADGFKVDVDGNLWCGWGMSAENDGVMVFNADGKPIGKIRLPERCANLCFGGEMRNRLFMASSRSLYALYVNTQGAPLV